MFHGEHLLIPTCDYCGHRHAQAELCTQFIKRGMSRRSFLFLGGAAAVGLALQPEILVADPFANVRAVLDRRSGISMAFVEAWNVVHDDAPHLIQSPGMFHSAMRYELAKRIKD